MIAITPNGLNAYVANSNDNTVSVINTVSNTISTTIPVGANPFGVAISPDGFTAYVGNNSDNTLSIIDILTNTVTATTPVGDSPMGIAVTPIPSPPQNLTGKQVKNRFSSQTEFINVLSWSPSPPQILSTI